MSDLCTLTTYALDGRCIRQGDIASCPVELCAQTTRALEAIALIRLGARAGLVSQLTGLEKTVAKRFYRQLHGRPSPAGLLPFTDTWYLRNPQRMLQAAVVWGLTRRFGQTVSSPAGQLIQIYESYTTLTPRPLLDIARVAFVPRLVEMGVWQEKRCVYCSTPYLAPVGIHHGVCPGCQLYRRYRCPACGSPWPAHATGRPRSLCESCNSIRKRSEAA